MRKVFVARYAPHGIGADLALRVYTTRLLGGDPALVLHGGGNTSVKTQCQRSAGRRCRCAVRQGFRLGHGRNRTCRVAGGETGAAAAAAGAAQIVR